MPKPIARPAGELNPAILVSGIFFLSLFLRVWGLNFGLPDLYHADEPIVVNHAMAYGAGDLNPHFFKIPPLASYLLFACFGAYFLIGQVLGAFQGLEGFKALFLSDPSSFYLLGRFMLGVLPGSLTCYALYFLGKKFFSKEAGLIAAFWLALNFLHVRDSHFIYADIPLLLVLTTAFFPVFRISEGGKRRDYVIFGILAGTAAAIKYNGVFIVAPFIAAHLYAKGWKRIFSADTILAGLLSVAAYAALNPFSLIDFGSFSDELFMQSRAEGYSGIFHHFIYSLNGALGFPLLCVGALGVLYALARRERKRALMAVFICAYYGVLVFFSQPYDRYVLPLIPFLLLLAGDMLENFAGAFRWPKAALAGIVLLAVLPSLHRSILCDRIFAREDVRTQAKKWIEQNIPAESRLALDVPFFMPRLRPTVKQLEEKRSRAIAEGQGSAQLMRLEGMLKDARERNRQRFELYFLNRDKGGFLFATPAIPYDLETCRMRGIDYVIAAKINPSQYPGFYDGLKKHAKFVARFTPYKDLSIQWPIDHQPLTGAPFLYSELAARDKNGQIIEVYRLD